MNPRGMDAPPALAVVPARESTAAAGGRDASGRWLPGYCPNRGGRPARLAELEASIREVHYPRVLEVLARLREIIHGDDDGAAISAAKLFLDRVMGPCRVSPEDVTLMTDDELTESLCGALGITVDELRELRAAKRQGFEPLGLDADDSGAES